MGNDVSQVMIEKKHGAVREVFGQRAVTFFALTEFRNGTLALSVLKAQRNQIGRRGGETLLLNGPPSPRPNVFQAQKPDHFPARANRCVQHRRYSEWSQVGL